MSSLISIPKVHLTKTSASFEGGIEIKEWADAGRKLCEMHACSQWWIGDWVNYGERSYQRNKEALAFFGKEILGEQHGFERESIKVYAWVARKIKPCNRLTTLGMRHHMEVARLSSQEQVEWLARAQKGDGTKKWPVAKLREEIRKTLKQVDEGETNPCPTITKYMTDAVCWIGREDEKEPIEKWEKERCELVLMSIQRIEPFKQRLVDRVRLLDDKRTN